MKDWDPEQGASGVRAAPHFVRTAAAVLGMAAMVIGLIYATRVVAGIFAAVRSPETLKPRIAAWADVLGGEALTVTIAGKGLPLANAAAVAVMGGAALVSAWLALGILAAGARCIAWTVSDREAVKEVLRHVLGPGGQAARTDRTGPKDGGPPGG